MNVLRRGSKNGEVQPSRVHKAMIVAEAALRAAEINTASWAKQEADAHQGSIDATKIEGRAAYVHSALQRQDEEENRGV